MKNGSKTNIKRALAAAMAIAMANACVPAMDILIQNTVVYADEIVLAGPGSIEVEDIANLPSDAGAVAGTTTGENSGTATGGETGTAAGGETGTATGEESGPVTGGESGGMPGTELATEESNFEGSGISFETEALAQPLADLELKTADVSGDWRLILVNGKNQLPEDYWIDTAMVQYTQNSEIVFDYRAVEALDQFLSDCVAAGYWPTLRAAHRTHATQQYLYQRKVQEWLNNGYSQADAEATAATIVALPGTSEHEIGLAADITSQPDGYLNESEADAPVQQWLMAHCTDYGFVLRFPKGKEDITGIMYEPWHYRYVGKEAAVEMTEKEMCLEEYVEYLHSQAESDELES